MDTLLKDVLSHLQNIQGSRKGGMGAPNNTYLPQLRVDLVDELAERVSARLATTAAPFEPYTNLLGSSTHQWEENVG